MKCVTITMDSLKPVMHEVTRELEPILESYQADDKRGAITVFLVTLLNLVNQVFSYLPPEEQSHILTACGTWFDVGLLVGGPPDKLTKILDKVNPAIEEIELPNWLWSAIGWDEGLTG